jgi:hypothetical protein
MKRAILIALSLVFAVSTVQAQGTSTTPPAKLDEKKADLPKVEDKKSTTS